MKQISGKEMLHEDLEGVFDDEVCIGLKRSSLKLLTLFVGMLLILIRAGNCIL